MRVELNGNDITGTVSDVSVNTSFDMVFSTVTMSGAVLLSDCKFFINDDISYDLTLWSCYRDGASFKMTFVSKLQYRWLMSSVRPVTGEHSFDSICKKLGIPFAALSKSNTKYYELPHMTFFGFMDWIQNRVSCVRAWLMTFHFDGLVGIDTESYHSATPPPKIDTPIYSLINMTSGSEYLISARSEGSVTQRFVDKDEEVVKLPTHLSEAQSVEDMQFEFVTVDDLAWVSPNISKQQYVMNVDTATRMNVRCDKAFFVLGALFTDQNGSVFFVNSLSANEGGQTATLCYVKGN